MRAAYCQGQIGGREARDRYLTDRRNRLASSRIKQIVAQVARARKAGRVVLVSSGAVAAGMEALGYEKRPARLEELQACAAVGQSRLMAVYQALFAAHEIQAAQVLLTHADLQDLAAISMREIPLWRCWRGLRR